MKPLCLHVKYQLHKIISFSFNNVLNFNRSTTSAEIKNIYVYHLSSYTGITDGLFFTTQTSQNHLVPGQKDIFLFLPFFLPSLLSSPVLVIFICFAKFSVNSSCFFGLGFPEGVLQQTPHIVTPASFKNVQCSHSQSWLGGEGGGPRGVVSSSTFWFTDSLSLAELATFRGGVGAWVFRCDFGASLATDAFRRVWRTSSTSCFLLFLDRNDSLSTISSSMSSSKLLCVVLLPRALRLAIKSKMYFAQKN